MSREVRRVPLDWDHPRKSNGQYQPMLDRTFEEAVADWEADAPNYATLAEHLRDEPPPDPEYYRPEWPVGASLGWQMYESVSEGTPVSPVFASDEELVEWLTHPQPVGIGGEPIAMSREAARRFVDSGYAPSMVYTRATGFITGLEALAAIDNLRTALDELRTRVVRASGGTE